MKNFAHFVESIKDLKVEEDEILVSYDNTALYPGVPQNEAINIIHEILTGNENLKEKTSLSADNVIELFKICVKTTYFAFNKDMTLKPSINH